MADGARATAPAGNREVFLAAAAALVELLADPALAGAWGRPSVLPRWRVGGLAAHAARALHTVVGYLDAGPPDADATTVDAAGYVLAVLPDDRLDLDHELQRAIRARGDDGAGEGPAAVHEAAAATLAVLRDRLPATPGATRLAVLDGVVLTLDDYLATRVVELVVHLDDLAAGLGVPTPAPPAAVALACDVVVELARRRRGELVVLRALARRERVDGPIAL